MWWSVGQPEFARAVVVLRDVLLEGGWFLNPGCCSHAVASF